MEESLKLNIYNQLGAILRQARDCSGLSLDEAASKSGFSPYKLAFMEHGSRQYLSRMPIYAVIYLLECYGMIPLFEIRPVPRQENIPES